MADSNDENAREATAKGPLTVAPFCPEEVRYCRCSHRCQNHPRRMHRLEFETHAAEQSELREIVREARRLGDRVQERLIREAHRQRDDPEDGAGNGAGGDGAVDQRSGVPKAEDGGEKKGVGNSKVALHQKRRHRRDPPASLAARARKGRRAWKTPRLLCRCETCLGKDGEQDKLVSETTWRRHNKARLDSLMKRLRETATPDTKQAAPTACESGIAGSQRYPWECVLDREVEQSDYEEEEMEEEDPSEMWREYEEFKAKAEDEEYARLWCLPGPGPDPGRNIFRAWLRSRMQRMVSKQASEDQAESEGARQQASEEPPFLPLHPLPGPNFFAADENPDEPVPGPTSPATPADVTRTSPVVPMATGLVCPPILNPSLAAAVGGDASGPGAVTGVPPGAPSLCTPKRQPAVAPSVAPGTPTEADGEEPPAVAVMSSGAEAACGVPPTSPAGAASPDDVVQAVKKVLQSHGAPTPLSRDLESALGLPPCSLALPLGAACSPADANASTGPLPIVEPLGAPACGPLTGPSSSAAPGPQDEELCQETPEVAGKERVAGDGVAVPAKSVKRGDEERGLGSPIQYQRKRVRALQT